MRFTDAKIQKHGELSCLQLKTRHWNILRPLFVEDALVERDLADGDLLVKMAHGLLVLLPEAALVYHFLDAPEGDVRHDVAIIRLHAGLLQQGLHLADHLFKRPELFKAQPQHPRLIVRAEGAVLVEGHREGLVLVTDPLQRLPYLGDATLRRGADETQRQMAHILLHPRDGVMAHRVMQGLDGLPYLLVQRDFDRHKEPLHPLLALQILVVETLDLVPQVHTLGTDDVVVIDGVREVFHLDAVGHGLAHELQGVLPYDRVVLAAVHHQQRAFHILDFREDVGGGVALGVLLGRVHVALAVHDLVPGPVDHRTAAGGRLEGLGMLGDER